MPPVRCGTYTKYKYGCRCGECRETNNQYNKARYHKNREALQAIKMERGCADCGYRDNAEALQFDHLDAGAKRFKLSGGAVERGMNALLEEIAKCEVVCANCHVIRTQTRRWADASRSRS